MRTNILCEIKYLEEHHDFDKLQAILVLILEEIKLRNMRGKW